MVQFSGSITPTAAQTKLTPTEYFALEAASGEKHEYYHGEVFAMTGARDRHNEVALNSATLLRETLRGKGCQVYIGDVRLEVEADGHYSHPDVFVTCDPRDRQDPLTKRYATLVVEVLSEGTASYDRGLKARQYRKMPSLAAYMLVDTEARTVEVQSRGEEGVWQLRVYESEGDSIALPIGSLRVAWNEVFATHDI